LAEDAGEKTEAPTPRRRQQAAEQGQVARSPDLVAAALVVGAMLLLSAFGGGVVKALQDLLGETLSAASFRDVSSPAAAVRQLGRGLMMVGKALLPLFAGLMLIAAVGNLLQVGLRFNLNRLQPNLAALNPFRGVGRMFGGRSPARGAMSFLKFVLIAAVAYSALRDRMGQIVLAQDKEFAQVFGLAVAIIYAVAMRIGIALLILAILDYVWQRWQLERELRMTKQEVKDEMRSMEGDPKVKQRRRQIAYQIASRKLKKDVPTADVVVTNPTEFAVALKYDPESMHAPKVIAKGQGLIAARIRQLAVEAGVPILERKPLARALYKLVEVGHEIPEQFYAAVAEILAYVYELSGKKGRRVA
jgi:flagellar biosynthetic protein FlhB